MKPEAQRLPAHIRAEAKRKLPLAPIGPLDSAQSSAELARLNLELEHKQQIIRQAVWFTDCVQSKKELEACTKGKRRVR